MPNSMKPFILTSILLLSLIYANAAPIKAINNGDWNTPSTWDLGRVPTNGDVITIPAGITVTISSNINTPGNTLTIDINGTLTFAGGGAKLTISSTSSIVVNAGGMINSTGSPSQTLKIGSNTVFQGNQSPITGSQYANITTGNGFVPFFPLPVKFISFSLAVKNNNVLIQWSTAEETNSSSYEIERSMDGATWSTITTIAAAGNSSTIRNYSYTDYYTIQNKVFYRIKQNDIGGNYTYTSIKELKSDNKSADIKIASNGQSTLILQFPKMINDKLQVRIVSFSGQILSIKELNQPFGQILLNTNIKGNYIIFITNFKDINVANKVLL